MSRSCCGLRRSLGSLSTDGWGCVPTQLVAWPESFLHWHLETVGWDQVFMLMTWRKDPTMALTSTNIYIVEGLFKNGSHQFLCPQGKLQAPPASLGIFLRQVGLARAPIK